MSFARNLQNSRGRRKMASSRLGQQMTRPSFQHHLHPLTPWHGPLSPGWEDGLLNFGYHEYEGVVPLPLEAATIEEARTEAAALVQERVSPTAPPEGYWIMQGNGIVETVIGGWTAA